MTQDLQSLDGVSKSNGLLITARGCNNSQYMKQPSLLHSNPPLRKGLIGRAKLAPRFSLPSATDKLHSRTGRATVRPTSRVDASPLHSPTCCGETPSSPFVVLPISQHFFRDATSIISKHVRVTARPRPPNSEASHAMWASGVEGDIESKLPR